MTFQEFFEKEYKYRSKDQKIANAKYDYHTLQNNVGSMEAIQLVCIVAGANGGVTDEKYGLMVELSGDRASKASFTSLVRDMYTPYMIQRVCTSFHKDKDTIYAAIAIVLLFASIKGYLSNDDNQMINYIWNGK